jgi:hypothetical protein
MINNKTVDEIFHQPFLLFYASFLPKKPLYTGGVRFLE